MVRVNDFNLDSSQVKQGFDSVGVLNSDLMAKQSVYSFMYLKGSKSAE